MGSYSDLLQCALSGLALGSIYAIIALGFTIIYNSTEIVNFAQGEFVTIGALTAWWLTSHGMGIPLALLISVGVTTVVGMLLGWVVMRPLKDASVVSLIIITIGASQLLVGIASKLWGKDPVSMTPFSEGVIEFKGAFLQHQDLWVLGVTVLTVIALTLFFERTQTGKAIRAASVNRHGARLVGISVQRMVVGSFALSAAIGALGGAVVAPIVMPSYNSGLMMGLKGFAAAVLGGMGNSTGAILAGLILGIVESLGGYYSSSYKDAFAFIILLLILFIKPSGLLGARSAGGDKA